MVRFAAAALALVTSLVGLSAFGSQILLLDFATANCGPCRQMEPLIQAFQQAGYPIRKVDATREPQVAQQHGVTRFPTFVMLVDGREITRTVGMTDSNRLQQMFQQARETVAATQRQAPASPQTGALEPVAKRDTRPLAQPTPPASADPADESFVPLLNATVRLRIEDPEGRSCGTGTIIDARQGEALIVTCGHLFRDSKGKGPVAVELFDATEGRLRPAGQVSGWVLSYDLDRDIALVVIRPGRPVAPAPLAPPGSRIERGDRVVSIGCSNGQDPTALPTRVTMLDRYKGPPNIEASGAPVEGRSGGGLFNDKGELIGVCFAADYEGNEGLYAALESIHDEVARLNMVPNATGSPAETPALADSSRNDLVRVQPVVRGQMPSDSPPPAREPMASLASTTTAGPANQPNNQPPELSKTEQAALDEIDKRAAEHEVIIIVRPKQAGGQSELMMLDKVSPEFIRALEARKRDSQPQPLR